MGISLLDRALFGQRVIVGGANLGSLYNNSEMTPERAAEILTAAGSVLPSAMLASSRLEFPAGTLIQADIAPLYGWGQAEHMLGSRSEL